MGTLDLKAAAAEFVAMTLFVFLCCGAAVSLAGSPQQVALTFGTCIAVLVYAMGHRSGGHINVAVTIGLVVNGDCGVIQGLANFVAQMLGSVLGAGLLGAVFGVDNDKTGMYGSNAVNPAYSVGNAFVAEMLGTFLLMYVVLETACTERNKTVMAALAIGLSVYIAHSLLIPIDGCSINPTRSFGPALIAQIRQDNKPGVFVPSHDNPNDGHWIDDKVEAFEDHWVFWLGPIVGSLLAVGTYKLLERESIAGGAKEMAQQTAEADADQV